MAFVSAELLIEYAIRIGVDDIMKDPSVIDSLFFADPLAKMGRDLTPENQAEPVYEQLIMDIFQKRLQEIPRRGSESGQESIFKNSIPTLQEMKDYLASANINIVHGFPRELSDLPAISIVSGNEDEGQYLGVQRGVVDDSDEAYELIGSDANFTYNITIITPNYDETVLWHAFIKFSLLKYRHAIEAYGFRNQNMTWLDLEPASQYLQSGLFVYQKACLLRGEKEEFIPVKKVGYSELAFTVSNDGQPVGGDQILPEANPEEIVP